eukprot:CAMPEP_0185033160 /NCGR_PEP_ID=MMETSP1103-20130426/21884_1 /TAXON_ID=36769 /ORGANISM="Paraphysomonas bandaiensis, Strain Caron Lab Isolate" /LENGTH=239 /DNA_ID=CAMNT_0027569335 /DNA_START=226 /DNA_END=945 /DNA_ORIENTATION=-
MHYNLGCSLQEEGKLREAIDSYKNALEVDPSYCDAQYNLANALQLLGRIEEAEIEYKKTIDLNPSHQLAYYNLGYIYFNDLKDPWKGIEMLKKSLEIDPTDVDAQINMALALNDLGMIDDVINCYQYIIEHNKGCVMAHFNLGNAYLDAGRIDDALASFQHVVMLDPEHADAYFNMALMHQEQANDETCTDSTVREMELSKALRCYRAVEELGSKVDESLVEEARRAIYQIEALKISLS